MATFREHDHPRASDGTFTEKSRSEPVIGLHASNPAVTLGQVSRIISRDLPGAASFTVEWDDQDRPTVSVESYAGLPINVTEATQAELGKALAPLSRDPFFLEVHAIDYDPDLAEHEYPGSLVIGEDGNAESFTTAVYGHDPEAA